MPYPQRYQPTLRVPEATTTRRRTTWQLGSPELHHLLFPRPCNPDQMMASTEWTHRIAIATADTPVPVKTTEPRKATSADTFAETKYQTRSNIRANLEEV